MIPNSCIKIETNKFPILSGEAEELFNENMYGKALCQYFESCLPAIGINVLMFLNEDWGWWLEVEKHDFKMALCIYSDPCATSDPESYAIMPSIHKSSVWSWSKFRMVNVEDQVLEIIDRVVGLLEKDEEITKVTRYDDFPY